jgi:hypothetical protein
MDTMPIAEIIKAAGGAAKLAEKCGVDRTTPYSWQRVPAEHLAAVAEVTGLPAAKLRPDLARAFHGAP